MRFFSDDVRKTLSNDFTLFILVTSRIVKLDSDVDPTHNPDWVMERIRMEEEALKECQDRLIDLRKLWEISTT